MGAMQKGENMKDEGIEGNPCRCEEAFCCSEEAQRLLGARDRAAEGHSQRRRELVALGVFGVLVLAGFVVLTSYINAGHNLNVAATSIDDIAGDMTGYDVVLFEGTALPSSDSGASANSSESQESSSDSPSQTVTLEEARKHYGDKNASVMEVGPDSFQDYVTGRIVMKQGHAYGIFSLTPDMVSELVVPKQTTTKTTTTQTETSPGIFGITNETVTTRTTGAYDSVSDIFSSVDPESVDPGLVEHIQDILDRFAAAKVDTVIALTTDPTPFCSVEGVDVVISFKRFDRFSMAETIDGTLYFDAPEIGDVGVLMIAPGNVASTKVLTEVP